MFKAGIIKSLAVVGEKHRPKHTHTHMTGLFKFPYTKSTHNSFVESELY